MTQCEKVEFEYNFWAFEERKYTHPDGKIIKYQSRLGEGYIDHQSVEGQDLDIFFENIDLLKALLFSSQANIHTDNDNN